MSILVLTGIDVEARRIARRLRLDAVAGASWPHFRNESFEVAPVGLGACQLPVRAAVWRPASLILSCGVCGGLAPQLSAGDLVVPEAVLDAAGRRATAPLGSVARRGTLVSTAGLVSAPLEKARLHADTGALAVDMESAAILAWASAQGTPGAVVRAVSDGADEDIPAELLLLVSSEGAIHPRAVLHLTVRRPHRVASAIRMARASRRALDAVAEALLSLAHEHVA